MTTVDLIRHVKLSTARLPLAVPISDAKVLTGRQKPMTEVVFLFAEITTEQGHERHRLQLLQARRRPGPVRPRQGDRRRPHRRGPQRHRQDLRPSCSGPAPPSGRSGRGHPGHRRHRHRAVRPQGQARRPAAGQAARRATATRSQTYNTSGGFLHAADRARSRNAPPSAGRRHRRHQDQGRPARHGRATCAASPAIREHLGGDVPAHGRRQPAVGPRHRAADGPPARGVQPGLDRGAAGRLRLRGPRRTSPQSWTPPSPPARCWPASPSTWA